MCWQGFVYAAAWSDALRCLSLELDPATGETIRAKDDWNGFPHERAEIYDFLAEHRISGVLLLSGEADPFARIDLLRTAVDRLGDATLRTWPRVGHGVGPVLDEAVEEIIGFLGART